MRRSRRAKHFLLHVDINGEVEVVVPWRSSWREAEKFVEEKRDWLAKTLAKQAGLRDKIPRRQLVSGALLPLLGKTYILRVVQDSWRKRSSFGQEGNEVSVFVNSQKQVRDVVIRWYKKMAKEHFTHRVNAYCEQIGVKVNKIVLSDAKSQWGSCMPEKGRVSLAWRLMLGSADMADYVIAHEVAHFMVRGHNKKFWQVVGKLMPGFERQRRWLRQHGYKMVL